MTSDDAAGAREPGDGAAANSRPHTRTQRLYRFLFRFYGPAQTGPPPYATPEEVRRWEESRRAPAAEPTASQPPPGYRVVRYTDEAGTVHHSIVRDDAGGPS
ncbi:MAG: hypothetical protein U0Q15_04695 [Kineosporiaceae bacterium]